MVLLHLGEKEIEVILAIKAFQVVGVNLESLEIQVRMV